MAQEPYFKEVVHDTWAVFTPQGNLIQGNLAIKLDRLTSIRLEGSQFYAYGILDGNECKLGTLKGEEVLVLKEAVAAFCARTVAVQPPGSLDRVLKKEMWLHDADATEGWATFSNGVGDAVVVRLDQIRSFQLRPAGAYDVVVEHCGRVVKMGYATDVQIADLQNKITAFMKASART